MMVIITVEADIMGIVHHLPVMVQTIGVLIARDQIMAGSTTAMDLTARDQTEANLTITDPVMAVLTAESLMAEAWNVKDLAVVAGWNNGATRGTIKPLGWNARVTGETVGEHSGWNGVT